MKNIDNEKIQALDSKTGTTIKMNKSNLHEEGYYTMSKNITNNKKSNNRTKRENINEYGLVELVKQSAPHECNKSSAFANTLPNNRIHSGKKTSQRKIDSIMSAKRKL